MNRIAESTNLELPKEILCPNVQESKLIQHLKAVYGLKVTKLARLNGYADCNFHVSVEQNYSNPHIDNIAPGGYFAKVSNINDSNQPEVLQAQLTEMKHLVKKGIPCQVSVRSINGEELTDIKVTSKKGEERIHKVSLRSFLPGEVLNKSSLTKELLYNIGAFVAKVSRGLEDFHHPCYDNFDRLLSMNNTPQMAKVVHAVNNEKHRVICEQVLKAFDDEVIPIKHLFRKGQVHGDLNEQNILVQEVEGRPNVVDVSGLLDFQDSAYTYPLYDVTINAAYMMMAANTQVPRPQMPGYILAGYSSLLKLNEAEQKVFHTLVASRMVMSLVYGAYSFNLDPTNEYILETARCGWDALVAFWETPKDTLENDWKQIVETYTH